MTVLLLVLFCCCSHGLVQLGATSGSAHSRQLAADGSAQASSGRQHGGMAVHGLRMACKFSRPRPCCREAVERHSTDRCFLASSDEEPVLAEFPKVMPGKGVSSSSLDLPHSPKPQPQPV
jgi:hypothetical protein